MPFTVKIEPNVTQTQAVVIPDVSPNQAGLMTPELLAAVNDPAAAIPDASTTTAGLMTPAQVEQLNAAIAVEDLVVYVNPLTGNDSNPGTQALPVATIMRGMQILPGTNAKVAQLRLAAGAYTWDNWFTPGFNGGPFQVSNPVGPNGLSVAIIGEMTNEVGDRVADAPSGGTSITDSTLVVGVDAYRGAFLECIAGGNATQRRMIISNTAGGQFFLNVGFDFPVVPGDVFRVMKPGAVVTTNSFFAPITTRFTMIGVELVTGGNFLPFPKATLIMCSCAIDLGGGFAEFNGNLSFSGFPLDQGLFNPLNPFPGFNYSQAGVYIKNGAGECTAPFTTVGYVVADNFALIPGRYSPNIELNNPSLRDCTIAVGSSGTLAITGGENGVRGVIENTVAAPGPSLVTATGASRLDVFGTDINNAGDNAIDVLQGSTANIGDVGGTGSLGAGLHAGGKGKIIFDDGASPTTVTGAVDTLVGVTPQTYAALAVAANQTDVYGNWISPVSAP